MKNFAQLNDNNIIVKTVVADSLEWCIETYGGKWIDITDTNCGIGKIYDALKNVCVLPLEDDCLFWCVFSHRNANGEVQQEAGLEEIPYI